MGNLTQEHHFNTSDVPVEGLGIAQWTGGRRDALMQRGNYLDIHTQLQYLADELNSTEQIAGEAIRSANTVADATIAFQNKFERCNPRWCMQDQRIGYANQLLEKYE